MDFKPKMLFAYPKSKVPAIASVALAALLAGCSSTDVDPTAGWSPNKIYSEARDEASSGSFDKAIPLYEKLEGRAAGTAMAQQAQLEKAYSQYKSGEKAQAIATLDRFVKLHPASEGVDYALYLKGLVNFNENLGLFSWVSKQDLSERDQKAAKDSFESFRELTTRFPESKYTPDAEKRMRYIVNSLAQYEVHVARYYYERGAYVAAVNRAQSAISDYKEVPAQEDALYILMLSYERLNMADMAADTKRVLEASYPNTRLLANGFRKDDRPWWKMW
ncbi:outer membrane protein assembly factor BamD [Comamonas sp. BIGb0152]|nr:outer membrane protein assembly factor BamD [Comamonas sp. BIGb0152]MCS4293164.1 outer membrane protein assembly factor BamD [Comamonas sp. BIGb0152]